MAVEIVSGSSTSVTAADPSANTLVKSSYVIDSNTDICLIVLVCQNYYATTLCTSVSWNPGSSESLTQFAHSTYDGWGSCQIWYKTGPTTGTGTVTATFNHPGTLEEGKAMVILVAKDVSQSTSLSDKVEGYGTSSSRTIGVANMGSGDLAIGVISADYASSTITVTTGTLLYEDFTSTWTNWGTGYNTGTGTVNVVFGLGSSMSHGYCGARVVESTTATGNPWYYYAQQMRQKLEEKLKRRILIPGFADCMRYGFAR